MTADVKAAARLTGAIVRTVRRAREEYGLAPETCAGAAAMTLAILAEDCGTSKLETAKRLHDMAYGLELSEKDTFDA